MSDSFCTDSNIASGVKEPPFLGGKKCTQDFLVLALFYDVCACLFIPALRHWGSKRKKFFCKGVPKLEHYILLLSGSCIVKT